MNPLNTLKFHIIVLVVILLLPFNASYTKILRNPALISKMMSDFKDNKKGDPFRHTFKDIENNNGNIDSTNINNNIGDETGNFRNNDNIDIDNDRNNVPQEEPRVISVLQSVLCRNFPSIPCNMIVKDPTLKKLIERSIQQVKYKKLAIDKTTVRPQYSLTLFPEANSDAFANFISTDDGKRLTKLAKPKKNNLSEHVERKSVPWFTVDNHTKPRIKLDRSMDTNKDQIKDTRKSIRKFYPQKNKQRKETALRNNKNEFTDYSGDKLSMSVEIPEINVIKNYPQLSYKVERNEDPVWRIDYMKHSGQNFNVFGPPIQDNSLRGKLIRTGPNVVVDNNNSVRSFRKEILHPDVYIKKKLGRKNSVDINSDGN